ncbi:MAG: hypothetical protein GX445_02880 [Elusimicrobia bacterium]|nr:hypothetical protein [Elusimicrobiota bacterium]
MSSKGYIGLTVFFPQFEWLNTTGTVRVEIKSGTNIIISSITLTLGYGTTNQIEKIGVDKFSSIKKINDDKDIIIV